MKQTILKNRVIAICITLCFGVLSCSKAPEIIENEKELIPVSFKLGFSKEITDFNSSSFAKSLSARSVADTSDLACYIYDANTRLYYGATSFDNYKGEELNIKLPEGDYVILFALGMNYYPTIINHEKKNIPETLPAGILNTQNTIDYPAIYHYPYRYGRNTDLFYDKIRCKVEKDGINENQITLDRIIGKVAVVIEDAIPECFQIKMEIENKPGDYFFSMASDATIPIKWEKDFFIQESEVGSTGYTMTSASFENINADQSRYPVTIKLTVIKQNSDGVIGQSIITTKTIENVDILKNKTVIYRGNLFDNITPGKEGQDSSFDVLVNDDWDDDVEKTY